MTFSVTRDVTSLMSALIVRYIGTRGLKLDGNWDLNIPNVFYNPTLFDALERTRRGENVELFDQMFMGLNLNPGVTGCDQSQPSATCGPVNGTTQRGSQHLRLNSTFRTDLANGTYAALANRSTFKEQARAAGTVNFGGQSFPVNEGQFSSAPTPDSTSREATAERTFRSNIVVPAGSVSVKLDYGQSPGFRGELLHEHRQVELPLVAGSNRLSERGKNSDLPGNVRVVAESWRYCELRIRTQPTREKDYNLAASHVTHDFRANGTFSLPFGPNRVLFSNASGWAGSHRSKVGSRASLSMPTVGIPLT